MRKNYQTLYPTHPLLPPPPLQDSDLPEGWESRKAADGRTYYVDHKTKATTWDHPKTAQEKAGRLEELGPLPVRTLYRYCSSGFPNSKYLVAVLENISVTEAH